MVGGGGRYAAGCVGARFGTLLVFWMCAVESVKTTCRTWILWALSSERLSKEVSIAE